jgi:membrane fusion protein (multidrug efflux system)
MNRLGHILVLTAGLFLASCKDKPLTPQPPAAVNLITVKAEPVQYFDRYPATTQALSQVDIRPQVQGYITGIFFTEGSHVRKGQKLYVIDERLYKAAFDQAEANVKVAQGNMIQAQQDADRYQYLMAHNAVAKQTLDHAVITLQNANNEVHAAEEARKTAATNLTYSVITAPFDGTIGFSQVKMGNLVTGGTTILNTISTDNPMAVDFLVNESQLNHYEQLQRSKQHLDSLFTIITPDKSIYPGTGKITVIDRAVDPQTGTIRVRLVFSNPKLELRAGMSCVVRVHNQESSPQIVIPGKSIVEQMGEYFVYRAKDTLLQSDADSAKKSGDSAQAAPRLRAFQVKVETGQTLGSNILIKSGLSDGDRVVIDGVQALHDGSLITASSRPANPGNAGSPKNRKGK